MVYGYARVSTSTQIVDRQVKNIERYAPDAKIYKEHFTGTRLDRPQWIRLYNKLQPGDTVVFDEVSRMSRDADEGFKLYMELYEKGVNLVFLKEPHINTQVYKDAINTSVTLTGNDIADIYIEATNRVLMLLVEKQVHLAFEQAQKEVEYVRQRTKEGMEVAKEQGKRIGTPKGTKLTTQKSKEAKKIIKEHCVAFGGSLSDTNCRKLAGVSRNSYFKYKKELLQEL